MTVSHWSVWTDSQIGLFGEVLDLFNSIKNVKDYRATDREYDIIDVLIEKGHMKELENDMVELSESGITALNQLCDMYSDYLYEMQSREADEHAMVYFGVSSREECSNCRGGGCLYCNPSDYLNFQVGY